MAISGGGEKKIFNQKIKVEAKSKVGSTDNIRHKAGGGNIKVGQKTCSPYSLCMTTNCTRLHIASKYCEYYWT